jgi:thioredoxin-like negative regulator of GroEL
MIRKIDDNGFAAIKEKGITVVAFSAAWCPPCKVMGPIYEEAASRFPGFNFLKADQEVAPEFFQRFGVQSIPTYVVLKEGREIHRQVGALPGSKFQDMLNKFS